MRTQPRQKQRRNNAAATELSQARQEAPEAGARSQRFLWMPLALMLTLLAPGQMQARPPQTLDEYTSLMGRERAVNVRLQFLGIRQVDTGFSIEDRFVFRSPDGVEFLVRLEWNHALALQQVQSGSELAPFRMNHVYELDLKFQRQTATGLLIVKATPAEVWELRLAREIPAYTGDITEQDLRVRELLQMVKANEALPQEYRLYFSRRETLHLVFYDIEGKELRFQYRKDRWETDELKKVRFLIPGAAYAVSGDLKGLVMDDRTVPLTDEEFNQVLENRSMEEFFLLFEFESAVPLRKDQILY